MLEKLRELKGRYVIVDYHTNNHEVTFAKGFLDIDEKGKKIIVQTGERLWFISVDAVVNLRVGGAPGAGGK